MMYQYNKWYDVNAIGINDQSIRISLDGRVNDSRGIHLPSYLSSNGYLYEFVHTSDNRYVLKPFDFIMASTFVPVPKELIGKPIKVNHKNGRSTDCDYQNLEWVEDIEEWRDIIYKDVKQGYYQVSNWGRVRSMLTNPPTIMKTDNSSGYQRVWLVSDSSKGLHCQIHRLVATHFICGYSINRKFVNHIDCDHNNCKWYNLEWVTIQENNQHAFESGRSIVGHKGDKNAVAKISEKDAIEICYSLNKNNGSINKTYNELKDSIPGLTYPIVSMIKYDETFVYISNKILTDEGRKKQIRQTDPDVILEVSYCLKENKGDVKKTRNMMISKYPWITLGWIWHLKDKSVGSDITDQVFSKDEFPKCNPLTEADALLIIDCLMKHKGVPYINQIVFDELKDQIDGLTKDKIRSIKEKKSWKILSDKYFSKEDFI